MGLDIVHISSCKGFHYLVLAKDNFSEQVKNKAVQNTDSKNISYFIKKDLVHRYGAFDRLILNKRPENKDLVDDLTIKYNIKKIITSAYHSQVNSMVERDHRVIINGLTKLDKLASLSRWVPNLSAIL